MTDFLKNAGSILASIAPTIASTLGGPLAGTAVNALIGVLGLAPESTQTDVMKAIASATPEQLLAIKTVEANFQVQMKKLEVDLTSLEVKNTEGARAMAVATKDYTQRILAGLIVSLYIGVQYYVLAHVLEPEQMNIVMRSLGTLDASLGLVLGFYFGSSLGSHKKDAAISTLQGK